MRVSAWASLWSVPGQSCLPQPCRHIASRRIARPRRQPFHTSVVKRRAEDDPLENNSLAKPNSQAGEPAASNPAKSENLLGHTHHLPPDGSSDGSGAAKPRDPNNYGSASNRARRNKSPKELPPVHIPEWLLERKITLFEELKEDNPYYNHGRKRLKPDSLEDAPEVSSPDHKTQDSAEDGKPRTSQRSTMATSRDKPRPTSPLDHPLNYLASPREVMWEVMHMLRAALKLSPTNYGDFAAETKTHITLVCPKNGASQHIMLMVQQLSYVLGRFDFLRLNAQDIAEIGGNYLEGPGPFQPDTLSSLGYDTSLVSASRSTEIAEQPPEEEDFDEDADENGIEESNTPSFSRPFPRSSGRRSSINVGMGIIPVGSLNGRLQEAFKWFGNNHSQGSSSSTSKSYVMKSPQDAKDSIQDLKMGLLVETLLNAPERKIKSRGYNREWVSSVTSTPDHQFENEPPSKTIKSSAEIPERASKRLVVFVEDYPQINTTMHGGRFLEKLHEAVDARRKEGQKIVIVGTASSTELLPSFSRSGVNEVQAEPRSGPMRTLVLPVREKVSVPLLTHEHKRKIRSINLRHVLDMIRRLVPKPGEIGPIVEDWNLDIDSKIAFLADLEESVWTMDRVNRVATFALALQRRDEEINKGHIEKAMADIYAGDQARYSWVRDERAEERKAGKRPEKRERDAEERIRKLRTKCNSHEKKLLNGVVDAESIRTTFADVRAPPETIDALKTLTSLSLVRPDAFMYGVLATDRIPGLLLYGPPGTGKTLLAKAVAKESGATVLEVSGSDVYDMYVGEGEKNVRAIFSLAKKLSPCIIFIDEADAILGSRGGPSNRTSHRELINQFLREWDGMTDLNAFIMVATNRPFDLDEASLRRLPRRLLVDLPVEKDREAILKIHLKDEILDSGVSLSKLASETPFYSGSDLKNLCVAAALACVREEYDTAAEYNRNVTEGTPDAEKYKYAEKRVLHERHLAKGMDEISASISEDMGSLSAIRKFDEKYGDRKGRRKKLGGYGFKTVSDGESKGSDAARVRNQT